MLNDILILVDFLNVFKHISWFPMFLILLFGVIIKKGIRSYGQGEIKTNQQPHQVKKPAAEKKAENRQKGC